MVEVKVMQQRFWVNFCCALKRIGKCLKVKCRKGRDKKTDKHMNGKERRNSHFEMNEIVGNKVMNPFPIKLSNIKGECRK